MLLGGLHLKLLDIFQLDGLLWRLIRSRDRVVNKPYHVLVCHIVYCRGEEHILGLNALALQLGGDNLLEVLLDAHVVE